MIDYTPWLCKCYEITFNLKHRTEKLKTKKGPFNNYVTLKLPSFDTPTLHHHASSRLITEPLLHYFTLLTQIPPFIIYFSFLKLKKRYAPTNDTSTHAFKQLNQIVRFNRKQ